MANLKLITALVTITSLILTGCINQPKPGSPEAAALIEEKKIDKATENLEKRIEGEPKWATERPKKPGFLYGFGESLQDDISTARRSATLKAQVDIAGQIRQSVSNLTKGFQDQSTITATGNSDVYGEVNKRVIAELEIKRASVKETKVIAVGGKVQAWVLVEYPEYEVKREVVDQIKKDKEASQQANKLELFKELEKEVERMRNN